MLGNNARDSDGPSSTEWKDQTKPADGRRTKEKNVLPDMARINYTASGESQQRRVARMTENRQDCFSARTLTIRLIF